MKRIMMLLVLGFVVNAMAQDTAASSTQCDSGQDTTICGTDSNGDTVCGSAPCPSDDK